MIVALGTLTIATPNTRVPVASLLTEPLKSYTLHGIMFLRVPTNLGVVTIGDKDLVGATFQHCFAYLDEKINVFTAALTISPNGLIVQNFYVDGTIAGDQVIVTILVA